MSRSIADISHISKYCWYDWVMFRDNTPTYPDKKLILGRYLGPVTDVRLTLTAKILKSNGQFVCRSTLQHLTNDKLQCRVHTEMRTAFDRDILHTLGPTALTEDFPAEDINLKYDHYNPDIFDLNPDFGDIEVKHEYGDNYVRAEVLIPRGETMTRGRVTKSTRDAKATLRVSPMSTPSCEEIWPSGGSTRKLGTRTDCGYCGQSADRIMRNTNGSEKDLSASLPLYVESQYAKKGYELKACAAHTPDAQILLHRACHNVCHCHNS